MYCVKHMKQYMQYNAYSKCFRKEMVLSSVSLLSSERTSLFSPLRTSLKKHTCPIHYHHALCLIGYSTGLQKTVSSQGIQVHLHLVLSRCC